MTDDYQRDFCRANRRVAVPVKPERQRLLRKTNNTQGSVSSTLTSSRDKQQDEAEIKTRAGSSKQECVVLLGYVRA